MKKWKPKKRKAVVSETIGPLPKGMKQITFVNRAKGMSNDNSREAIYERNKQLAKEARDIDMAAEERRVKK